MNTVIMLVALTARPPQAPPVERPPQAPPVACFCDLGQPCICKPETCRCQGCPIHKTEDTSTEGCEQEAVEEQGVVERGGVLFLTADWCEYCPAVKANLKAAGLLDKVVVVDVSDDDDLMDRLGVDALPCIALVKDGRKVKHVKGADNCTPGIVRAWLKEFDDRAEVGKPVIDPVVADARDWIEAFAVKVGGTYDGVLEDAEAWVSRGDYVWDTKEVGKRIGSAEWKRFWRCYELVTATRVPEGDKTSFFVCVS